MDINKLDKNYQEFVNNYSFRLNRKVNVILSNCRNASGEKTMEYCEYIFTNCLVKKGTNEKVLQSEALKILDNLDYCNVWVELIFEEIEKFNGEALTKRVMAMKNLTNEEKKN